MTPQPPHLKQQPTFWGIGVGPGDGEWLTLKGLRVLQSAPVVALPQNQRGEPGLAFTIVRDHLQPHQTILPLALPFVTEPDILRPAWQTAVDQLLKFLNQGQDIAFVTLGDISFYSTFTYLSQTLQAQAPWVQIAGIPGVCAPLAAAAALNIPLAIAQEKVAVLPAMYTVADLDQALAWADVVVLMKVAGVFKDVWQWLHHQGLLAQASLVEWVGWQDQDPSRQEKVFPSLVDLEHHQPAYFSLVIIRCHGHGV